MDNRKYTRLPVIGGFRAKLKGDVVLSGTVADISPFGLCVHYQDAEQRAVCEFNCIDISKDEEGFELKDIPCKVVYEESDPVESGGDVYRHRCGLRFKELSGEHKSQLDYFLSNFTTSDRDGRQIKVFFTNKLNIIKSSLVTLFIDFLLLTIALLGVQYLKRHNFHLPLRYLALFAVFYIGWFIGSFWFEKYRRIMQRSFFEAVLVLVKCNIALVYIVSFTVVLVAKLSAVSRMQVFGACLAFLLLEILVYVIYAVNGKINLKSRDHSDVVKSDSVNSISYPLMAIDAGLLFIAFMVSNFLKRGSFELLPRYDLALMIVYATWGLSLVYVKKYKSINYNGSFVSVFNYCVRAALIMVATLVVVLYAGRLSYYSRMQILSVPVVLLALELGVFYLYWLYRRQGRIGSDIETVDEVKDALGYQQANFQLPVSPVAEKSDDPVAEKLKHALEFFDPRLFAFINNTIDLNTIDRKATALMSTEEIDSIDPLASSDHQLLVNLHKTNDVRWFNRYFLKIHGKLKSQGFFIGKVHTVATHYHYFMSKYPKPIALLAYLVDFIWYRVFPKLPVLKKLYFTITRGRNRIVSKAEIFGRLYFCGFRIVDDMEIGNQLYFIAQKVRIPSYQTNPTYGPLVQLKRIGMNGELMTVYKFRTMFPYSEFLQEYIYERNSLQEGGKFKDDFRVTGWGKFMRTTWLDELPMLYNWLKGEMKLFGVRPLSRQYLSLYPQELQNLRAKTVPGLIPPFYADMPKTLGEIVDSELHYIKSYLRSPFRTQVDYFWRSAVNILFRGARSG